MVTPIHKLRLYSDGRLEVADNQEIQYYRVPHDIERRNWNIKDFMYMGDGYRSGPVRQPVIDADASLPEVYRVNPFHHVVINCDWQRLWRALNPRLSVQKWSSLLGNKLAWTNWTGFPGHYNCLTREDSDKPLPRFDQARLCGGALLTGVEKNGLLFINSLRNNEQPPSAQDVLSKPWLWYWGTSINPDGKINVIPRIGVDGNPYGVIVPNLTATQATLPLSELDKLPMGAPLPSPTWLP